MYILKMFFYGKSQRKSIKTKIIFIVWNNTTYIDMWVYIILLDNVDFKNSIKKIQSISEAWLNFSLPIPYPLKLKLQNLYRKMKTYIIPKKWQTGCS